MLRRVPVLGTFQSTLFATFTIKHESFKQSNYGMPIFVYTSFMNRESVPLSLDLFDNLVYAPADNKFSKCEKRIS